MMPGFELKTSVSSHYHKARASALLTCSVVAYLNAIPSFKSQGEFFSLDIIKYKGNAERGEREGNQSKKL